MFGQMDDTVWTQQLEGRQAIRHGIGGMKPEQPGKHVACATVAHIDGDRAGAWTAFTALADAGRGVGLVVCDRHGCPLLRRFGQFSRRMALRASSDSHGRRAMC
jgi:hypothetical protein